MISHWNHAKRRTGFFRIGFLVVLSLALAGCGAGSVTHAPTASATSTATVTPTSTPTPAPSATPTPSGPSFAMDVQPILIERCIKCHSVENPPRGLRLTDYENVLLGSTYRPVVIPGNPEESEIMKRIRGEAIPRMPFDGPPFLEEDQIALIEAWIADGALNN